jgi:LuxR family maltose regulon positive regulatory protein
MVRKGVVVARSTPRVYDSGLVGVAGAASSIAVGSPAWYAWLEDATSFLFTSAQGSFTACKERRGRTGWYWKAYRRRDGTLHRAYLGKSADLTLDRLNVIASDLAQHATEPPPRESSRIVNSTQTADGKPALLPIAPLPMGTLTFLFTDIESSTQLWEQHPQAMPAALARHDRILGTVIAEHHGRVFKTIGDSAHAVFATAPAALAAALATQRALHAEPWGPTGPLHVRMALHTGVAEARDGDYYGSPLNRVARILALGHGGQILLSQTTHDLVADDPPAQTSLRDLGEYHLKDLRRPEQIFQLVNPDLPAAFPPLATRDLRPAPASTEALQFLATKLYVPPPRPHIVPRERLVERLRSGLTGKLTLIAAPAGFGKTTLVSAWLASLSSELKVLSSEVSQVKQAQNSKLSTQNFQVAWVSLDVDDNDPTRFWTYVIAALETIYPAIGATALALLRSTQPPPAEVLLTSLINAITPMATTAALILDDYHLISTPAIHTAITFLLDHGPPHLHLIMLTRADPPMPLTRLRTRGELTELRAADLRFTADEAAAFLTGMMGLPLTSEEVVALEARTEGWVAGLQLAALAMQNRPDHAGFVAAFSGSNRFVVDYLVEEVLNRLPAHLQMFLLQTSILDRMCGSLCDAVLGLTPDERPMTNDEHRTAVSASVLNTDRQLSSSVLRASSDSYSQLILNQLERANLFLVPLDDERHWYRYHHLFAEVLRARLAGGATAGEVAALHQRASAWHEQAGLIDEAIRYALLVQDVERAAALIERHAIALIFASSNVLLVQTWVAQLPRALILARPRLVLIAGFTMALAGQFAAVERLLADAAPAFSAPDLAPNSVGELALLRAMIARVQDDAAGTLALAQQALAQLDPNNHSFRAGATLYLGVVCMWRGELGAAKESLAEAAALGELGESQWIALAALEELASLQARHGQLREVLRTAAQAAQLSARMGGQRLPAAGMDQVASAEVWYEWNDLARAMHAAIQGIDLLQGSVERLLLVRGYCVLALVYQAQADSVGALDSIHRGEAWFAQTAIAATGPARAWLSTYQARLWMQQGNLTAAAQWAQACAFASDSELGYVQQLTLARLRLAQSHTDSSGRSLGAARTILAGLLPLVEARGWTRYLIEILMLQALVCQGQADRTSARVALEHALTLAEPEGYLRIFVDAGRPIAVLLAQLAGYASPVAGYATRLLEAFGELSNEALRTVPTSNAPCSMLNAPFLVEPLSTRELEILRLIADGHSNQAIADRLVLAVSTVKKHVNNLFGKLDVQSRTQALLRAQDLNLL